MSKKYFKILIAVIISCILVTVFFQIGVNPLSRVQIGPKALSEKNVRVSLVVSDKEYQTLVGSGATVLEVMENIQNESSEDNIFDFKYTEHPGLGIFINEINDKGGGSSGYWIYYVNGIEASVGVSNYKIKEGDIISWKYEK